MLNALNLSTHSHPPTYYLPPEDVNTSALKQNSRHTFCEWKGSASYFDFKPSSGDTIKSRIWTYETPSSRFKPIKGYFSFYAGPWECYVDDAEVKPQPGDFYGGARVHHYLDFACEGLTWLPLYSGWMTSDIDGVSLFVSSSSMIMVLTM